MKKIVHVITDLDVGGAEMMLYRLLSSSVGSTDYQHIVISLTSQGPIAAQLIARGFVVFDCGLVSLKKMPAAIMRLRRLLQQLQPDIVQTWMYHADFIGGLVARWCGYRNIIWGIRSTQVPINSRLTGLLVKINARLSYLLPKKIVCVAQAALESHRQFGFDDKRMLVIGNGIDLDEFFKGIDSNLSVEKTPSLPRIIGCVGRYHADKGQDLLVQSFAQLLPQQPDLRLMLIGRGCDSANQQLVTLLKQLNLEHAVDLLGERQDIAALLHTMDIYCMPSRSEGFPNGLVEAMACGLPCVATDVGDARLLGDGVVQFVAPASVSELTRGLQQMLEISPAARLSLGQQAAQRIKQQYSIDVVRSQFEALYSLILR
ncbi:MAG: glycosyltransferase family 4 protein [Rheinheimera sp.]